MPEGASRSTPPPAGRREELLAAHANRDLDGGARAELAALVAADAGAAATVEGLDRLHELFDAERELRQLAALPPEPWEREDPLWQQLARGVEAQAGKLRQRLVPRSPGSGAALRRWVPLLLAAAAVIVAAFWLGRGSRPPALLPTAPDGSTLGGRDVARGGEGAGTLGNFVMLTPRLATEARTLSWQPVVGARAYDVVVLDAAGNVVLRRDESEARSTEWTITSEQFRSLQQQASPLSVRVLARDGVGVAIGSSGDLPLSLAR